MGNGNLYIGNINYKASVEDLNGLFGQHGNVISVKLIEKDGLKKGFGFVEFDSEESAKSAQEALNNQEFMGRNLRVDFARPRQNNYNKPKY